MKKIWPRPPFNGKKITPAVLFGDYAPLSREGVAGRRGNPQDCKKIARSGFLTLKKDPRFSV